MTLDHLGEAAVILRELPGPPWKVARALANRLPGIVDAVPSYQSVGLYFQETPVGLEEIEGALAAGFDDAPGRCHRIPVCYELGPDLSEAASRLGIGADELVASHAGSEYLCSAVGFQPGFPYLGDLDGLISGLPRRGSPRVRVPAGSVGITGVQTGIYAVESPGGWWLIGRTPLTLVDVADRYFPIGAGDRVQFFAVDKTYFDRHAGERL